MNTIVPLISSLVSLAFALSVLDQFLSRRKPYQLVWSIGLLMYSISTGMEFLIEAWGMNSAIYRLGYLTGAVFIAAYLGMGTVYLLTPRRLANIMMAILAIASIYAAVKVAVAPLHLNVISVAILISGPAITGHAMPQQVCFLIPFFNTFGTVALVGGALYSAWAYWRYHYMPHRVLSNVLIAVGGVLPSLGSTLNRFNLPQYLYFLELAGIIIIFLGFLCSREVFGLYRIPFIHGFRQSNVLKSMK